MALTTSVGATISMSATLPTTFDDNATTGYPSLTFTQLGWVEDIPEYGPEATTVEFTPVDDGIIRKFHGPTNYGSLSVPVGLDFDDAGQTVAKTAQDTKNEIAFEIKYDDGLIDYCSGKVMSFKRANGAAGGVRKGSVMIEFERDLTTVS
jgi:hypothetical protein